MSARFMEQLLAPLPDDVEQVADKRFLKTVRDDARKTWGAAMRRTMALYHQYQHLCCWRMVVRDEGGDAETARVEEDAAFRNYARQVTRQVLIPAPDKEALRWKQGKIKVGAIDRDQREAAIAADEARFAAKAGGR